MRPHLPNKLSNLFAAMQRDRILLPAFMMVLAFTANSDRQCYAQDQVTNRPNVLIVMADDLGFSDLGCYGSEIETPNLDRLAASGVKFSQFYNTAKCHSSRVSLLTGQYCIAAGDTALSHGVTSAEVLATNGYFTAMTGKWHLKQQPTDFGFQRYFGHLSGACNYFTGDQSFRLNGMPWKVPAENFYTTVANVDFAIDFLEEARAEKKPWYLYVAFNAPHAPLHALPNDYKKYENRYNVGWDEIRKARFVKQQQSGLLPSGLKVSERPEHVPSWKSLHPWRQQYEAKKMSTLAAMIDRVDQEVGRLTKNLKDNGELNNTLILFVSDNGACPYDRKRPNPTITPTNANDSLGDTTGWAWARNTPFRYYKQNQFEGGIASPAILHWPAGVKATAGSVITEPAHLIDILPTIADVTGSRLPEQWPSRELRPISGQSLRPLLGDNAFHRESPLHFLFSTDRGLRENQWKIVSFRQGPWELYDLSADRTERNNLASQHPDRLKKMIHTWTQMTREVLHAPERSYSEVQTEPRPHTHPEWTSFDGDLPDGPATKGKGTTTRNRNGPSGKNTGGIRARKNTNLNIEGGVLHLTFTGDDPGIAMDLRSKSIPAGPYQLRFRVQKSTPSRGEIFFTTDPQTTLPNGEQLSFKIHEINDWQWIEIPIVTQKTLFQIRIDLCDGVGNASIADLELRGSAEQTILRWPQP
ncbi:arylsulfatase [Rubripirellula sp.]|nr:arylsulfatase [Rubripirellula sp.]